MPARFAGPAAPSTLGRHQGAYVPAKDRPTDTNATNHSAPDEGYDPLIQTLEKRDPPDEWDPNQAK
ncbi:hypothetical protein SRABI83_01363 [Arthrobacter sp. Bi83]|uniref:hypothetical protein n=1 Tax=Arthrobacter sp. Bi83 TaxID=2822353 RepID=UPI001DEB837B|nr:hypothetical protein [Arthrobacter sp. Bi83]CAH0178303.1 hypothetical protein SRABI83_01363 [Arthrobacter sp. Bi83]